MFDLQNYKNTKKIVIDMIKSIHKWDSSEGFIADGLISPEDYENCSIKIAVILGESYGYDECGVTYIETQPDEDLLGIGNPKRQTSKKVPSLLWMLYKSFSENKLVPWDDIPWLFRTNDDNTAILQESLKKAAWINVKKASKHIDNWGDDATRQDYNEIYQNAIKNKDILKIQLDSISPDLIILCSDPVCHSLCDMGLLGNSIDKNNKWNIQVNENGQKILHVNHPSYFKDWGYEGMYKICKIIFESYQ